MKALRWAAALAVVALLAAGEAWYFLRPAPPPPAPEQAGPTAEVLARLKRGVNLSNWLQQGPATNEAPRYAPNAADFALIRSLGLTHVRIPVDPSALLDEHGLPNTPARDALRAAIAGAAREQLLVVLALQLPSESKAQLAQDPAARIALAGTWRWLADALQDFTPQQLAFEPLNEPEIASAAASRALLEALVGELRAAAPLRTLVVSGGAWSAIDALEPMQPLADRNLVYSFHFYEPHDFTHQGATWGDARWAELKGLRYPSPAGWDRARVAKEIDKAARWGKAHGVPVWCGEFGVLKTRAAPGDRAAWLRDVRESLEARGIGWAHWDYAGPFGLVTGNHGRRKVDAHTAKALGLSVIPRSASVIPSAARDPLGDPSALRASG